MKASELSAAKLSTAMLLTVLLVVSACVTGGATSAEEYFSLGMAYYDQGKYEEAEKWLNRARMMDKTRVASEYNLGRIAYETGRYEEAVRHFERALARDGENVLALKAAAYSRIKIGDLAGAEELYERALTLEPESADQGYNYALVLMALDKPEKAEEVLLKYKIVMVENKNTLLLLARAQKEQNKVEAADSYSQWLQGNNDAKVRYEYAQVLESAEFYAKALEEYRAVIAALPQGKANPDPALPARTDVRVTAARLLLIADPEKDDGIAELETAVTEGLTDTEKLTALLNEPGVSANHKDEIRSIIEGIEKAKAAAPEESEPPAEGEEASGAEPDVQTAP
ncbi:MAG: tetratricopeptide repeat protein [Treponema sp.]|jgi:tetratricopeptide (TPR) repeat protein|nr:tetratricopeptide repeat protein [Treponema sp.]